MSNERTAYELIKYIPLVNVAYSIPRTIAYAVAGNEREAIRSLIGIPSGVLMSLILPLNPQAAQDIDAAAEKIVNSPDSLLGTRHYLSWLDYKDIIDLEEFETPVKESIKAKNAKQVALP
jgi:hypothetical protein